VSDSISWLAVRIPSTGGILFNRISHDKCKLLARLTRGCFHNLQLLHHDLLVVVLIPVQLVAEVGNVNTVLVLGGMACVCRKV